MYTIITGASSGIGKATAIYYAKQGENLVLIARGKDSLNKVKIDLQKKYEIQVEIFAIDLTEEKAEQKILDFINENKLKISCLINNAGIGFVGEFSTSDLDKQLKVIELNVLSITKLTYAVLPLLKQSKDTRIVFISSIAGLLPCGPYQNIYYASKCYVTSFAKGLRSELKQYNISVTTVFPGLTKSNFLSTAGAKSKTEKGSFLPEVVAKDIYNASKKRKKRKLTALTFWGKTFFVLLPILPKGIIIKNTERVQKNRIKK